MGINRDDMLELTRRMTPSRTCFTRVAGCYVDADGDFDGSFNIHFGKLNAHDREQNLAWAKTISPQVADQEPGEPECGFLFPAFTNRSTDTAHINIYQRDPRHPHTELAEKILNVRI